MQEVGVLATIVTSLALVGVALMVSASQLRAGNGGVSGAWYFVATCFMLALWLLANIFSDTDPERALLWVRVSFASIAIGLTSLLLFVNRFPTRRYVSAIQTVMPTVLLIGIVTLIISPFVIPSVTFEGSVATVMPGPLYGIFVVFIVGLLLIIGTRLFKATRLAKRYRAQAQLILAGIVATASVALITNLLLPLILGNNNLYWLASVSTLGFVFATAYAIVKEGLFDVRLAVMRSVTYAAALATIVGIYYALVSFLAHSILRNQDIAAAAVSPLAIIPALVFIFTFQPVKRFFDKLTNNLFFKDRYSSDVFFAEFGQLLASTTDLRELLERASVRIASTFKAEQAFFQVSYSNGSEHYMTAGTPKHARLPGHDAALLDSFVAGRSDTILVDLLDDRKLQRMLRSHKVALVMPLMRGAHTIGYLMLGDHRSSNYTRRDLEVLASNSNGLIVAIQNALSLHELKALNATLQQRIDVATKALRSSNAQLKHLDQVKDEFMSMASHQLRTPLTSIKGYLSMVLDGDVGKITPQQEKLLAEAFNSSERMVHLIADFLNVSRLQTGKFIIEKAPIDFTQLVGREVANLQVMAKARGLEIHLEQPKEPLGAHADATKLREVITNLIDNAIYYSQSGTSITVKVEKAHAWLQFSVTDTGIGVPKEEQVKLFGKFYRATNARKQRPDGTGVGLYLAKKVITAHGGTILFHSTEGKGSTFGFRLPLSIEK